MTEIANATTAQGAALPARRERVRVVAPAHRHAGDAAPFAGAAAPYAGPAAPVDRHLGILRLLG